MEIVNLEGMKLEKALFEEEYDFYENLEFLKTEFRELSLNQKVNKELGLDLIWQRIK